MTVVRPAVQADLDAVACFERAVFDQGAWSRRSVEQELEAGGDDRRLLVAAAGSHIVAYGVLSWSGGAGDLRRIVVDTEHRRHHVATRLLGALLAVAREELCDRVLLEVAAGNDAALALYTSAGFVEIDRRRGYYAGGVDALVMRLDLVCAEGPVT